MAEFKKDLLNLKYSQAFSIQGIEESEISLQLSSSTQTSTTVTGIVTDGETPIADAVVKVFDAAGKPFRHTLTDEKGKYLFEGLPTGTYSVATAKLGFRMSDGKGISLSADDTVNIDFTLTLDQTLALGAIAGVVTVAGDEKSPAPISGAKITLLDAQDSMVAVTFSADDGEFAFYDVADGSYTLITSAGGYLTSAPMTVTIRGGSIVNTSLQLVVDGRTFSGTVNGVIRDSIGRVQSSCFVGLYSISTDENGKKLESLIAVTKTNAAGQYLFGGVAAGQYVVKAKKCN